MSSHKAQKNAQDENALFDTAELEEEQPQRDLDEVIASMREAVASHQAEARITLAQVRGVVDGLTGDHTNGGNAMTLDEVSDFTGLDQHTVLDVVAQLGTWLTHVHGGAKVKIQTLDEAKEFFPQNDDQSVKDGVVTIPGGFERKNAHRRDVSKALAAIIVNKPEDEVLARWLDRKYPPDTAMLTFSVVAAVRMFAVLGRTDVDEINPDNPAFNRLVIEAYDLMKVAIDDLADAANQLTELAKLPSQQLVYKLDDLEQAASKARWAHEHEMKRLTEMIKATRERPSFVTAVAARLNTIATMIDANPHEWRMSSIGDLNQAHLLRIAQMSGLDVEGPSRSEESVLRDKITELGFKADADRLVPIAVRAVKADVLDQFWEVLEARANGDTEWSQHLEDVFAEV